MKRLIVDLDNTIALGEGPEYSKRHPNLELISRLREYKADGFAIAIHTSRNMRTYSGNIGLICANTLPIAIQWLKDHNVPFDEVWVGKPWCGDDGFYIDDRAIRPAEFLTLSYEKILHLIQASPN